MDCCSGKASSVAKQYGLERSDLRESIFYVETNSLLIEALLILGLKQGYFSPRPP